MASTEALSDTSTATAIAFLILCGLGTWQLQRLAWKTDLLKRIDALQGAPARPLETLVRAARPATPPDYARVSLDCPALEQTPTLHLYALKDGEAGEDEVGRAEKDLDKSTGQYTTQIDELVKHKEGELLEV